MESKDFFWGILTTTTKKKTELLLEKKDILVVWELQMQKKMKLKKRKHR